MPLHDVVDATASTGNSDHIPVYADVVIRGG
jgi:hypothetical protein